MKTVQRVLNRSATDMSPLPDASVDLVVTSPPYPMIEMWDASFSAQDPRIGEALKRDDGVLAFSLMHGILDGVWAECFRVLRPGGFACINIGDATRTIGRSFRLFTNHSRITSYCESPGFHSLPPVIWRKTTNAPTKFMGSGMLAAGAYVTLEHEYILVFRKGERRRFSDTEGERRRLSAYFWEERNIWFSGIWDVGGARQGMDQFAARERSGAYSLEIPYRLVNMYSIAGDTVLDPFLGTGTTLIAALASGRNGLGFEIDKAFCSIALGALASSLPLVNARISERLEAHRSFVRAREGERPLAYVNVPHGFRVMTRQEVSLELLFVREIGLAGKDRAEVQYSRLETD